MAGVGEGGIVGRQAGNGRSNKLPYWLIASSLRDGQTTESIHSGVRNALLLPRSPLCDDVGLFDVPMTLKFGSFDDLIRAVDTLQKQDGVVEGVLRRVERQALEIDPEAQFKIMWQRHSLTAEQYIRRFTWDESKFPKARAIRENIEAIVQSVNKLDEEVRAKVAVWQEIRQQVNASNSKRDILSYTQRDLLDLLTPAVVEEEDFVQTEHLTTAVVCVPVDSETNWLNTYEKLNTFVVPRSAKKFNIPPDKEGVCLWRVVLFKKGLYDFKKSANEYKFIVRDFDYNEGVYKEMTEQRAKIMAEQTKHELFLSRVCFAAFSDIFVAWIHLKAMRVFCESVLRFGVPPNFVSFFLRPIAENKEKKIHKELDTLITPPGLFGNRFYAKDSGDTQENDDFYPYVLLTLQPFAS